MKKLLLALAVMATVALPMTAVMADPPPGGPPGQGECEHGNSGQTCVPDPQPTHGQDCEEHGPNEGGVNEDHCEGGTTSTTTIPPVTTTTTTTTGPPPVTTTTEVPPTVTTVPPVITTTSVAPTTVAPTTTQGPTQGPDEKSNPPKKEITTRGSGKLAFTGVENVVPFGLAALALLLLGSFLFWLSNRKVTEE